jgi:hypothetical protein
MWLKAKPVSPSKVDGSGATSCLRASDSSRAPVSPLPASAATASAQNSRPTTDAAPIAWRSGVVSRSSRAASSAWMVGGTVTSPLPPVSRR